MNNFQKYFEDKILNIGKLEHKGNNQLFKISLDNKKVFLLKNYSKIHMSNWERGKTEFKALSNLWNLGFREIPQPISFDKNENIGIYSYEKGKILGQEEITKEDIDKSVDFLVKLHNLDNKNKKRFSPASSACLRLKDYLDVIDMRISKIINYKPEDDAGRKARNFLDEKVIPRIEELKKDFFSKTKGVDIEEEIPINEQVLTPADFGFHNILVNLNGGKKEYKFLDFEYFGRDDPARQILDFIHHVKSVNLSLELKNYFIDSYMEKRNLSEEFVKRLRLIDPLIGMTWVLIRLNVLSKEQLEHIKFAQGSTKGVIEERLVGAEKKLNKLKFFQS